VAQVEALQAMAVTLDLTPLPGSVSRFAEVEHAAIEAFFHGRIVAAFVVSLIPTQQIPLHVDAPIAPAVRYHLPIRTNAACWCFHADAWRRLDEGRIYRMDPTDPHGAVNWGTTPRWHLLVDVVEDA